MSTFDPELADHLAFIEWQGKLVLCIGLEAESQPRAMYPLSVGQARELRDALAAAIAQARPS